MTEINIKDIFKSLLRRWWLLFICVIVFGGAAYYYTHYYLIPTYETYTTLYVGKDTGQTGLNQGDLYFGSALIPDYREIAKSKQVASEVIKDLGLSYMRPASLAGMIGVTQRNDSRVIQISIVDTNPQRAMEIANKVAEVFQKKVIEIMQVENVQIIDKAELQSYPIAPDNKRNIIMGIIIGLALGGGIAFLIEYMDNSIKTPEDVQKFIDLPVIGTIPVFKAKGRRA